MFHLTLRVPWHDRRWDGCVCDEPLRNAFCVALDRIREERNDAAEDKVKGKHFRDLSQDELPACKAGSGFFMSAKAWTRTFDHPYCENKKAQATHGSLRETDVRVPEYSTFAVPFAWMLRKNQKKLDESLPNPLPPDERPPFDTPWVFGRARQEALSELMFGRLTEEKSLVFFYAEHLIHRAEKGHMVRSKSELVIANILFHTRGLQDYEYERPYEGTVVPGKMRPDFSWATPAGNLVVWEHLGMMCRDDYRRGWEWKQDWYKNNGFKLGRDLFTTQEDARGSLDSHEIKTVAATIEKLL